MRSLIKERVSNALDGLAQRQASRNAARAMGARIQHVYKLRRDGALDEVGQAWNALSDSDIDCHREQSYGLTILHVRCGVMLA